MTAKSLTGANTCNLGLGNTHTRVVIDGNTVRTPAGSVPLAAGRVASRRPSYPMHFWLTVLGCTIWSRRSSTMIGRLTSRSAFEDFAQHLAAQLIGR